MCVNKVNGSDSFSRVNSFAARPTSMACGYTDRKIFRLFNQASRIHFVRFGRLNQIEAKDVFLRACADMKTVAVIRWIRDELAIFKRGPIFKSVLCR